MEKLVQITDYAVPDLQIQLVSGSIEYSIYLKRYRKQMVKHGRKAEVRSNTIDGKNQIALFADNTICP
jgi:hypothetical protein